MSKMSIVYIISLIIKVEEGFLILLKHIFAFITSNKIQISALRVHFFSRKMTFLFVENIERH